MTILDGTYSAFLVPISIAFSSDLNHWSWTTIVDVVAGKFCFQNIRLCIISLIAPAAYLHNSATTLCYSGRA